MTEKITYLLLASLSLYLICSAVQMNACAFVTQVHSDVIEAGVHMNYE